TGGEDLALWCQSRMAEGGIVPPHSVLAPGTALGLLPSRALSSAQANCMVAQGQRTLELHRGKKGGRTIPRFDPVVRSELPCNLRSLPFGPTRMCPWIRQLPPEMAVARPYDAVNGVALTVRNSH